MGDCRDQRLPLHSPLFVVVVDFVVEGIRDRPVGDGIGAWQDVVNTLIAHGYEVTARKESATETERELDKVDEWIVIEYGEVE